MSDEQEIPKHLQTLLDLRKRNDNVIESFADRILAEYKKHPTLEWWRLAAGKIYSAWTVIKNEEITDIKWQLNTAVSINRRYERSLSDVTALIGEYLNSAPLDRWQYQDKFKEMFDLFTKEYFTKKEL